MIAPFIQRLMKALSAQDAVLLRVWLATEQDAADKLIAEIDVQHPEASALIQKMRSQKW